MAQRTLGELEKSKLLNELALMPGEDKVRITRATERGLVLDDAHERDIQRAKLAQMPWTRWGAVVLYGFLAAQTAVDLATGERSGWLAWSAAIGFTLICLVQTRRWWIMRRLDQKLKRPDESAIPNGSAATTAEHPAGDRRE